MKKWLFTLAAVLVFLVGCNEKQIDTNSSSNMPIAIEVTIQVAEKLDIGVTQLKAYVSQGGEEVNDADEVVFEVWKSGFRDEGVMVQGELDQKGEYVANYEFVEDGVYYMFAHTTARGMHIMPKQQIIVGNPDMSKVVEDDSTNEM